MQVFNVILATDSQDGIGNTSSTAVHTLPWSLDNEFKYYLSMVHHEQEKMQKYGKKTLLVTAPTVFSELSKLHPDGFIWALISKSIVKKPEICDILSDDYSLNDLYKIIESSEWANKIGRIIVLGGVPLYNQVMNGNVPTRIFRTRINHDFKADRSISQLNTEKFKKIHSKYINDMPVLVGKQTEVDSLSGKTVNYEIEVFTNYAYLSSLEA